MRPRMLPMESLHTSSKPRSAIRAPMASVMGPIWLSKLGIAIRSRRNWIMVSWCWASSWWTAVWVSCRFIEISTPQSFYRKIVFKGGGLPRPYYTRIERASFLSITLHSPGEEKTQDDLGLLLLPDFQV